MEFNGRKLYQEKYISFLHYENYFENQNTFNSPTNLKYFRIPIRQTPSNSLWEEGVGGVGGGGPN